MGKISPYRLMKGERTSGPDVGLFSFSDNHGNGHAAYRKRVTGTVDQQQGLWVLGRPLNRAIRAMVVRHQRAEIALRDCTYDPQHPLAGIEVFRLECRLPLVGGMILPDQRERPLKRCANREVIAPRAAGWSGSTESARTYKSSPRRRRTGSSPFRCCSPMHPRSDQSVSPAAA
jgi:hypothetical protein